MKKFTIETKTQTEVEIITPSYRKSTDQWIEAYLYFSDTAVVEVTNNAIFLTNYSTYHDQSTALSYFKSTEANKSEFDEFYQKTLNRITSKL
jgi:hypothetical protein